MWLQLIHRHDLAGWLWAVAVFVAHLLVVARALTRPNRTPASRVAWVAVILSVPALGMVAYLLLGETSIGRTRMQRLRRTEHLLEAPKHDDAAAVDVAPRINALFDLCRSINGFRPVGGNRVALLGHPGAPIDEPKLDCRAALDTLIADIEQARETVHIAVYIWLDDGAGGRIADAVAAAARRGVQCRVMVDALGSRAFTRGPRWKQLGDAGVRLLETLDDIARWRHFAFSRADLRDHRKIVVIDNRIAYCGSQNCADPEFAVKPEFAPWIDILLRCEGPIVRQQQTLFLSGWIAETGEPGLEGMPAAEPLPAQFPENAVVQAFETGPITRHNAMSDMFTACMYAARRELLITTPYFMPDEAILRALCAAPRRGVKTTVVFPARNDSWLVGNACRSTYADLLACGVAVHEYPLGLLHSKSLTIDGQLALVGSANMDRRSLELNFENNMLIADADVVAAIHARQSGYLAASRPVPLDEVHAWPFRQRLVQNTVAMMAPVL